MPKLSRAIRVLVLVILATPSVLASGQFPPQVMPNRAFASFEACLAHLTSELSAAQSAIDPQPRPADLGGTIQHLLQTAGVVSDDPNSAKLDIHQGTEIRVPMPQLQQIRTNYSYRERVLVCTGPTLSETSLGGYYIEGYAPMP